MSGLTVAILGAAGTIAPAIVHDLAESPEEVAELVLLDLDSERAQAVAQRHAPGRAHVVAVDARAGLADALAGVDVLVNSASYRINISAMQACLQAGCHYLDLGGLYWLTGEQLALDGQFRDAGRLALLGMGSSPGKTNVMAVRAVRELGTTPDRIDVIAAGRDLAPPPGASYPYSVQTLVDELTMRPIAIHDGSAVELEPMTDGGTITLPDPVGETTTIQTLHSELRTFPDSFGCAEAHFRLSLPPAVLERVRALTDADESELAAATRRATPASSQTYSVHAIEATTGQRTIRVTATTRPMREWDLGGGVVSTAAPAAAAVRLLARGSIDAVGALPPERCVEPEALFAELERRNCSFQSEEIVN